MRGGVAIGDAIGRRGTAIGTRERYAVFRGGAVVEALHNVHNCGNVSVGRLG